MKLCVSILVLASTLALAGTGFASPPQGATPLGIYVQMHEALAEDSAEGVVAAALELAGRVRAAARAATDRTPYEKLAAAAEKMQGDDLATLREQFKRVSVAFAAYFDASGAEGAQLYFCPMADGYWLQRSADAAVSNPYYGKSMLRCGGKADKVEG